MRDDIQDYMRRPKRYDNIDGTGEMAFGLMMLGFTVEGYLLAVLPKDSIWRHEFVFLAGVLLMVGLMLWGSNAIKKHITWPRTGYVIYGIPEKPQRTWRTVWMRMATLVVLTVFISAVIIAAGVACLKLFGDGHDWNSLIWTGYAVFWVALYAFWIYKMERNHSWKWLVLLFMAAGLVTIAFIAHGEIVRSRWLMLLFVSLTWLASGGVTLYLYIRHTQPPVQESE